MKLINKLLPTISVGAVALCAVPSISACTQQKQNSYIYSWEKTTAAQQPEQYTERYGKGKQINFTSIIDDYLNATDNPSKLLAMDMVALTNKFNLENCTASVVATVQTIDITNYRVTASIEMNGKKQGGDNFSTEIKWTNVPFSCSLIGTSILLMPVGFVSDDGLLSIFQYKDWSINFKNNDGQEKKDITLSDKLTTDQIISLLDVLDGLAPYLFLAELSYYDGAQFLPQEK